MDYKFKTLKEKPYNNECDKIQDDTDTVWLYTQVWKIVFALEIPCKYRDTYIYNTTKLGLSCIFFGDRVHSPRQKPLTILFNDATNVLEYH